MRKSTTDKLGGALFLAFGLLLQILIPMQVATEDSMAALTPASFPYLISWAIIAFSLLLLYGGFQKARRENVAAAPDKAVPSRGGWLRQSGEIWALAALGMMLLYVFLLPLAGYLMTAFSVTMLMLLLFRVKQWPLYLAAMLFLSLLYFLFAVVMLVPLP